MAAHDQLGQVAPGDGPLDEFLATLQQGGIVDAEGVFTLDREKAREKMQRFQLTQPARYILELVQAAVLRGATFIRFEISATQVRMMCPCSPFLVKDFEDLYESLFARGRGGKRQALRHLALGVCTAMAMNPKQLTISGGGEKGASLRMRPGERDTFGKGGSAEHGLLIEITRRSRGPFSSAAGSPSIEQRERELLLDCCGLSMVPIELNGMPIASGYQLPGALYWRHVQQGSTRGVVAVANTPSPLDTPTTLHLMRNCISFERDTPPGLLPGFLALIESPSFHLDISHQRIVRNDAFSQALALVVEQQLQLLIADCEQICRGTWPHPVQHMRGLLLGLLERLGSLDPLARWAGLSGHFPREAPPLFPAQVPGAHWLLDAMVFPTTDKRVASLRHVLADRQRQGSVAVSTSPSSELSKQRPLVLLAQHAREREIWRRVLASPLDDAGPRFHNHPARLNNIERWRKRRQEPTLQSSSNLLSVKMQRGEFSGEVGIEIPSADSPSGDQPAQLCLTLLHLDGVLSVHTLPSPVRGLHAILAGEFSPTDLWDGARPDDKLAAAVDMLFQTLPMLALAIVSEHGSALGLHEGVTWLRHAVCGLFLLAETESGRCAVNVQLGLRAETIPVNQRPSAGIQLLHSEPMARVPLFECVTGRPLSLHTLHEELKRRGAIAIVARRSADDSELVQKRKHWAAYLSSPLITEEILSRAVPSWASTAQGKPRWVVWFDGSQEQLESLLQPLWQRPVLSDARPALSVLCELLVVLSEQAVPWQGAASLAEVCWLTVPIPELQGELGLLRDEQQHSSDVLLKVWVQTDGEAPAMMLCALPAGGMLIARVDRRALLSRSAAEHSEQDLATLRRALQQALLGLCDAQAELGVVPHALWQRFSLRLVTMLFPRPVFRLNYDRLRFQAVREGRATLDADPEHRRILSLSLQHSFPVVLHTLTKLLGQADDQPVTAQAIARFLVPPTDAGGPAGLSHDAVLAHADTPVPELPGALDVLDLFFPAAGSFDQRALQPASALLRFAVCRDHAGRSVTLAEVLEDVRRHGDLLLVPGSMDSATAQAVGRLLLCVQNDVEGLQVLHGLLGDSRLRAFDSMAMSDAVESADRADSADRPKDQDEDQDEAALLAKEKSRDPVGSPSELPVARGSAHSLDRTAAAAAVGSAGIEVGSAPDEAKAAIADTVLAVRRQAPLWLRITDAAASLIDSVRRRQDRQAEREERLLSALRSELRSIVGDQAALLSHANFSHIHVASLSSRQAVVCTDHQTLINRRHPAVKRALRTGGSDPVAIWFLCAAVYTAINVFFYEVTDENEAQFLALLCRRAEAVLQDPALPRLASADP